MSAATIEIPDTLHERLERFSQHQGVPIEKFLESHLARILPEVPAELPEDFRNQLFALENLSIAELREEATRELPSDEIPEEYTQGDVTDQLMLRKAYARALVKYFGETV